MIVGIDAIMYQLFEIIKYSFSSVLYPAELFFLILTPAYIIEVQFTQNQLS